MNENNEIPSEFEEQVRDIVRDEHAKLAGERVEDGDGESWSFGQLVNDVGLTRRQALLAMAYMLSGAVGSRAIVRAFSETAEAASTDDLTVPGTLTSGSVDTDEVLFNELSDGTSTITTTTEQDADHSAGRVVQFTNGVSTTATEILNLSVMMNDPFGFQVIVYGVDASASDPRFTDILNVTRGGNIDRFSSTTRNTPPSRSYNEVAAGLELTMGSDTYDVGAIAEAIRVA